MEQDKLTTTLLLDFIPTPYVSISINQFREGPDIFCYYDGEKQDFVREFLPNHNPIETEITLSLPHSLSRDPETITILYSNEEKKVEMTYRVLSVKEVQEFKTTYKVEPI